MHLKSLGIPAEESNATTRKTTASLKAHESECAQSVDEKYQAEDHADDTDYDPFDEHLHEEEDDVEDEGGDEDGDKC
jgi:hypothetical protein